jgi:hypothetical protein
MQTVVGIIGMISLIFATLNLFFPNFISFLNALGRDTIIDISSLLQKHRRIVGIFYLIAGIFMSYIGFFYKG